MTWTTWYPLRDLDRVQREINRIFDTMDARSEVGWPFRTAHTCRSYPLLNLHEDSERFRVEALAPGMDPESLKVSVTGNELTLEGVKNAPDGVDSDAYHRNERTEGKFIRTIQLPGDVDSEKVTAEYRHGILKIDLPRSEADRPRQISIEVK